MFIRIFVIFADVKTGLEKKGEEWTNLIKQDKSNN